MGEWRGSSQSCGMRNLTWGREREAGREREIQKNREIEKQNLACSFDVRMNIIRVLLTKIETSWYYLKATVGSV